MLWLVNLLWQRLLLELGLLKCTNSRTGSFPVGEIGSPQTATDMMVRLNSPWAPGHFCGVSIVIVVVVVLLFGSRAGTCQIRDQSCALEDRNDSNNSLEVHTPNSFIHLLYNSLYMNIVDMHNVIVTPSDSVLWEKTMEASYLVGSFPCQLSQISLTDIPVWDGVWEQATFRHLCTLW